MNCDFKKSLLTAMAVIIGYFGNAQIIRGNIKDNTGNLPGATVFINETSIITASDAQGNFSLKVKPGSYQLLVSMIGYESFLKEFVISDKDVELSIVLAPKTMALTEVVVRPDKTWFKNLRVFTSQFLGESDNAKQCKILNAEILTFDVDKKTKVLKASSDRLLKISNKGLGYIVSYLLTSFEYDQANQTLNFSGYPSFELMHGSATEEAVWKKSRDKAFKGSIRHFIKSIYKGDPIREGFIVYKIKNWVPKARIYDKSFLKLDKSAINFDTLCIDYTAYLKKLKYADALMVIYTGQEENFHYQAKRYSLADLFPTERFPSGQISIVNLLQPSVLIDAKGAYSRTRDLFLNGYMGWTKVSDLTPYGFEDDRKSVN